jgi:hypothetical protein
VVGLLYGPHRVGARLVMILLSQQGWPAAQIAGLLGCDPATVRRWIHRYNTHGTVGLADHPRPGRPRLGSPQLGARIRRLLAKPRAWTTERIWQQLGRPAISLRTLHRRVEVAAWRPRLVAMGDPDAAVVLAGLRQAIAELPEGAAVLAEDETHLHLLPWVRATCIPHGTRQRVMTPGQNRRRSIFGAVDLHSGRFFYRVARKAVSATFAQFLAQLADAYPTAPLVAMVCDNVIIHRSKLVQAWLAANPRVRVLHGARYRTSRQPGRAHLGLAESLPGQPPPPWPGASARSAPSSASAHPPSCWRPPRPPVHHGCPRATHGTSGRPLSIYMDICAKPTG